MIVIEGEYEVLSGKTMVSGPETGWKGVEFCQRTTDLLNKKEIKVKPDYGSFSFLHGYPAVASLFVGALFYCVAGFVGSLL